MAGGFCRGTWALFQEAISAALGDSEVEGKLMMREELNPRCAVFSGNRVRFCGSGAKLLSFRKTQSGGGGGRRDRDQRHTERDRQDREETAGELRSQGAQGQGS